ncbi:diguanylate cyclase [Paractinoplanes abujensis]|uniref:Diguanylate cyclase (GGDEF)-like protein n=1 Tax=Paractinoplanes abujensis TaxID=882441 RepID=A0A7W7CRH7_9ACTN|nr:diguanylate cyclase [Actinoplanes abujensis]MBB4691938.1 diguanylate cyclase (GGDEF)-like protein [Actinoplanes abujensis]
MTRTAASRAATLTGFDVQAELGRGAFTTVHRIEHEGRRYALKRPTGPAGDDVLVSFQREAALLACVDDPGVARIFAAGRYRGDPALVLEHLPGGSLADLLGGGPLGPERVVELGAQLARGLAAAHRVGLVHRDVKPGNIMVAPGHPAKLIDFGLAQLGDGAGAAHDQAVGTFLYSSPEQSGMLKRPVDGRSDLYSLGVVLFECLTGRLPFEASDVGELLRRHAVAAPPDIAVLCPAADPALIAVIDRLLAKDPDDRYPDAGALLADLRNAPGGAAAAGPAAARWPLAGRETEREQLARRWRSARDGHGGVLRIRGPAGSGRSRLAEEVADQAAGCPVLFAAADPDAPLPMAALRSAIDGYLQSVRWLPAPGRATAEQHLREAAAAAGPALAARLSPRLAEIIGAVPEEGRDELVLAAAAAFLGDLARRAGGLVLVLDDAHWLSPATREVLDRLGPDLPGLPLLVVLTEPAGEPGPDVAADTVLDCEPLGRAAVDELIASRLPGARVTAELTGHVADRTGGNPFAVVAYLWRLIDAGLLSPLWGEWWFDEAGARALPAAEDVRDLLASRLADLPGDVREVLVPAAVAGARFRNETLIAAGLAEDQVVAAVAAALDRRVLETRTGGAYAFIHPLLREQLLATVPAERQQRLHAAVADALEAQPAALRDAEHVYAVARHHQRAGDRVPAGRRRRSALAAGLAALDDQAPQEALSYLREAVDGDPAPPTAVLHPLAVAYLRAGRIDESLATIRRAIAGEPDRRARARLLTTEIEAHHTVWHDTEALNAASRALGELRRPLPARGPALVLTTLGIALAGAFVRRTGRGSGTATGRRREDLAALAAVLDAGGYAAAIGLRLREALLLTMRALYAVNRLGPCPEYVRVYALAGYVTTVVKLRGVGGRCLDRAARTAAGLGDPGLGAYVEWMRGCAMLFGGQDDGTAWAETVSRNLRWYRPAQMLVGHSAIGLRRVLRGYVQDARSEYERGLSVLADPADALGTSFSMLGVLIPAIQGRPGDAATVLADMRAACPPGTATVAQRVNVVVAAACAAVEEGEFGDRFDAVVAEFHALGLRNRDLMQHHKWFYAFQSHGRMAQLRLATDEQRPAALARARAAVAQLRRVRRSSPLLNCSYLIGEAALALMRGDAAACIEWTDKAERIARRFDSPIVHFEVARFRARAFRQLGPAAESDRHARWALALAGQYGWELRRRQVRAEFGADDGGATGRRTVVGRRSDGGRSRRLEALQEVGAAAATVLDPRQMARVTLDEMLRILGAERALFFLLDEAGEPVPYAGRGASGADLTETTAYGTTLVRRVADEGEALVLTGTEQGAALGSQSAVVHGLRSILVVPVRFKGRTLGVLYLDSRMARGIFTADDVEVLIAMSSHLATSLETARAAQLQLAVQTARQQQAFAETLRASLAELSSIHDPAQLLRQLFATLSTQLGATAGCLLGAGDTGIMAVSGTAPAELLGTRPDVAVPGPAPVLVDDANLRTAVVLAVPLQHREGRAGVALLGGDGFDDTARKVAAALAFQGMAAYDNARLFSRVQELATTDELTGQHNRRHFYAIAGALVEAAARGGRSLAAVMLDIDKFKGINDTYGHGVGDEVIREVANRVRAGIRHSDVLGRYGGEEFAVVLPDHGDDSPAELAERMRAGVAGTPVPTRAGPIPVTISVGVALLAAQDTLDQVLARADHALYQAKETGRNRVVLAQGLSRN